MSISGPHFLRGLDRLADDESNSRFACWPDRSASQSESSDMILATVGRRRCVQFNATSCTISNTWFAPSYAPLTSGVVFDPISGQYVAVLGQNSLVIWDGKETKLEKIKPFTLKAKCSQLLTDESDPNGECHIVFQSGHVQPLSYVKQNPDQEDADSILLPEDLTLVETHMQTHNKSVYVVHVLRENKAGRIVTIFEANLDPDSNGMSLNKLSSMTETDGSYFLGVCISRYGPLMVCVDKTGVLEGILLSGEKERFKIVKVSDVAVDRSLSLVSLDEEHVALLGDAVLGKGSLLKIISVRFSSVVANVRLAESLRGTPCLRSVGNHVFARVGNRIGQFHLTNLPKSLECMIGKQRENDSIREITTCANGSPCLIRPAGKAGSSIGLYDNLKQIMKTGNIAALETMLQTEPDIPELLVLSIIEYILWAPESKLKRKLRNSSTENVRECLLQQAFAIPITDLIMRQYLRQVSYKTVLRMLTFLDWCLKVRRYDRPEDLGQLIEWISLLLTSHYSDILIRKDTTAQAIVESLSESVDDLDLEMRNLATIIPLINVVRDAKIDVSSKSKSYFVEVVEL